MALRGGERAVKALGLLAAPSSKVEYGNLTLTLELVDSLEEAVDHIHANGSSHTDAIITGMPSSPPPPFHSAGFFCLPFPFSCPPFSALYFCKLPAFLQSNGIGKLECNPAGVKGGHKTGIETSNSS